MQADQFRNSFLVRPVLAMPRQLAWLLAPMLRVSGFSISVAQAAHHGFGLRIKPEQLATLNGEIVASAATRLLSDPSFRVCPGFC